MIELEHSPLGGSSAHRFFNCTASFLKQREQILAGTFEDVPSEFAARGTGAHELGALAIMEKREPYEFLGEEFNGYLAGWPDGIELDAVQVYVNFCRDILDRDPNAIFNIETTITAPHIHPLLKGTLDFDCVSKLGIDIVDYKNGEGIGVAANMNKQLLYYGFLKLVDLSGLGVLDPTMPMRLCIVQPNFYGIFEAQDVWETTVGFVWKWGQEELLPRMNYLTGTNAECEILDEDYTPGDHCQFCPVLLDCIVMQRAFRTYADAGEDFITMLTNAELDELYSQREYARRFMKALENTVKARKLTGADIKSAKLVEPKTARVWKPGAQAALIEVFGDKAYAPKEIRSPAQIEKLSSRGKELALEYGYKPDSAGLTIAPLSDPRPEAKPRGNSTVFAAHSLAPEAAGF